MPTQALSFHFKRENDMGRVSLEQVIGWKVSWFENPGDESRLVLDRLEFGVQNGVPRLTDEEQEEISLMFGTWLSGKLSDIVDEFMELHHGISHNALEMEVDHDRIANG